MSARASFRALPFSRTISRASGSERWIISSQARRRHSPRCRGGVAAQPGSASCAAVTASRASSVLALATSATASSVAGSTTCSTPARPPVHCPPISSPVGTSMPVMVARSAVTFSSHSRAAGLAAPARLRHYIGQRATRGSGGLAGPGWLRRVVAGRLRTLARSGVRARAVACVRGVGNGLGLLAGYGLREQRLQAGPGEPPERPVLPSPVQQGHLELGGGDLLAIAVALSG